MNIDSAVEHLGHHTHIESLDVVLVKELCIGSNTVAVEISVDNRLEDELRIALVVLHHQAEVDARGILSDKESHGVDRNTVNIHLVYMSSSAHSLFGRRTEGD